MKKILIIIIILLLPLSVQGEYRIKTSNASVTEAHCSDSCEGIGIACDPNYCDNSCSTQCCCSLGENTREIKVGRLTDRTEYLADKIIEWADKEIEAAEVMISRAQNLYDASGNCKSDNCYASCVLESTCAGCECGGCEEAGLSPVKDDDSCPTPGNGQIQCCDPQPADTSGGPDKIFAQTFRSPTLLAESCELPYPPTNLSHSTGGRTVVFFWQGGDPNGCDVSLCGACWIEPRFRIRWKLEGKDWRYHPLSTTSETMSIDLLEYGDYEWQVIQEKDQNGLYYSESAISTFTIENPSNEPKNLTARPSWGSSCQVYLDWESGCPDDNLECKKNVTYDLSYKNTSGGNTFLKTNIPYTSMELTIEAPPYAGSFSWEVRQDDGAFGESDWVQGPEFSLEKPRIWPPATIIYPQEHVITVFWEDNSEDGCDECTENCCSEPNEYRVALDPTPYTSYLTGSGDWNISDWMGRQPSYSHTFHQTYSGSSYYIYIQRKNGCGEISNWHHRGEETTRCGEGECQVIDACSSNKSSAPKSCSKLYSSICVDSGNCSFLGASSADCRPTCGDGKECCILANICVSSDSQCIALGGSSAQSAGSENSYCFGRCVEVGAPLCCIGIDDSAPSGSEIDCLSGSSTACCTAAYSLCNPQGCYGTPCPDQQIGYLVMEIQNAMAKVSEARSKVNEYYLRLNDEVPPRLEDVREKLGDCFMETGSTEAVLRKEQGVEELVSCQSLIMGGGLLEQGQWVSSFLPDENGNPKGYVEPGCYGNNFCSVMYQKGRGDEVPFDMPCAEDFYCAVWTSY